MTSKVLSSGKTYTYDYNLQNRLRSVTVSYSNIDEVTEYSYNDDGIRVKSVYKEYIDDVLDTSTIETKFFIIDSMNHTGYAQVLEELTYDNTQPNPNPLTDTPTSRITYTIGDDVISQYKTDGDPQYLLYDGHGSTRQLADSTGAITEAYSYDGYGTLLGGNPTRSSPAATSLLYTGEYYDNDMTQYNLRARYYDPLNGRFNQLDPYAGNNQDPQSLHKYLYCHANPVNAADPSGLMDFSLTNMLCVSLLVGSISALIAGEVVRLKGGTQEQINQAQWKWFWIGFFAASFAYSLVWSIHSIWLWIIGGEGLASNPAALERMHHFASNKHSYWTPRFEQIVVGKYKLSLNDVCDLPPENCASCN